MNHYERQQIINRYNDGNHVNGDRESRDDSEDRESRIKCGFCGEIQEDPEAKACNGCLEDEFIKNYTNGR